MVRQGRSGKRSVKRSVEGALRILGLVARFAAPALLLSGCAVGPDYRGMSIELPARWSNGKDQQAMQPPVLAQWWRRMNDPLLNQLMDEAVRGNLDVSAAKARIREARALRRQAVGELFPSMSGSGSATTNRTGGASLGGVAGSAVAPTASSRRASMRVGSSTCSAAIAARLKLRSTTSRPRTRICARRC